KKQNKKSVPSGKARPSSPTSSGEASSNNHYHHPRHPQTHLPHRQFPLIKYSIIIRKASNHNPSLQLRLYEPPARQNRGASHGGNCREPT
ncbi:hypothetical protein LINPERHAP2_LOCUS35068, partial [Linum perenne]